MVFMTVWDTLREHMRSHMVSQQRCAPRITTLHIRKAARPEPRQQVIYQALNLAHNPGGVVKTIIPDKN